MMGWTEFQAGVLVFSIHYRGKGWMGVYNSSVPTVTCWQTGGMVAKLNTGDVLKMRIGS
jgi:hypothetical protein